MMLEIFVKINLEEQPEITLCDENHNTTLILTKESIIHLSNELNRFILQTYPKSKDRMTGNSD